MDAIIARIKGYVLVLYPTILADLVMTDDQLDFVIAEVVDRALAFMNRDQLVYQYEKDLLLYPLDNEDYNDYWAEYALPIPARLERVLANATVGTMKNVKYRNDNEVGAVKSVSDNGQSISYSEQVSNFLNSSDDAEVFSGIVRLLQSYFIPVIPNHETTSQLQN